MKKLLVVVYPDMNDVEYANSMVVFGFAKIQTVCWHHSLKTVKCSNGVVTAENVVNEIDLKQFAAVFIPGGVGASQVLDKDQKLLDVIKYFKQHNLPIFAICDTPNVLYKNGIITDQQSYSSFPNPELKKSALRNISKVTVVENLVTGRSAGCALEFATAAACYLQKDPSLKEMIYQRLFGLESKD